MNNKRQPTPGPWFYDDTNRLRIAINSESASIASIPYLDDEARANARLIAAAPDLMEAAKNALHYMRLHRYADQAWADDLEAAVRKATGEAA